MTNQRTQTVSSPELRGNNLALGWCTDREVCLDGPAGCVAGETLIYNPITQEHTQIKELYEKGIAPIVQTLMGAIQAEVPFRKGVKDLYRVTLVSGRECVVTDNHRLLTQQGWKFVSDLSFGDLVGVGESNVPLSCALHSWDTVSSIKYERTDEYFDLHVPLAEHYLAEGIWHHNTGKTVGALFKIHVCLSRYPGARALVARKTNTALSGSAMVTYRNNILRDRKDIRYFGGNKVEPAAFRYPNGSEMIVNGLDRPEKVQSTEIDYGYINEAVECDLEDIEFVRMRLRPRTNGPDVPYRQLIMDVNPSHPNHWLNLRMNEGITTRLLSRHEDNPRYWDLTTKDWTKEGREYVFGILGGLTGVRLARYRYGIWAAAEGTIYEDSWDRARNVIKPFPVPVEWPRYLVIDFGFTHPFVCLWCAIDPDGRIYVYRQIYMTKKLVEDHAKDIKKWSRWGLDGGDPLPREIICDHDAEGRATLERHLGLHTTKAYKKVLEGIQAVSARFLPQLDGKPRFMIMRDSLVEIDKELQQAKRPTCTEDEPEVYVWSTSTGVQSKEEPVKKYDDGLDCTRYICSRMDLKPNTIGYSQRLY